MKEVTEEIKTFKTLFEAFDGTRFDDRQECEKYESSAGAVVFKKLMAKRINSGTEYNLFNMGSDDVESHIVVLETEQDVDNANQLHKVYHPKSDLPLGKENIGDIISIACSTYDDNIWIINLSHAIRKATKDRFNIVSNGGNQQEA